MVVKDLIRDLGVRNVVYTVLYSDFFLYAFA